MDSRLTLPVDTVLDGGYRITRVVGSGGFGITYAAEDVNLGTTVALKEYYPFDFGDRDASMSVKPKSERHKQTFDWGRSNFLQEARTLARFEHPSIVRVTRAFEANSTAYMVMRFEEGQSFEVWLRDLGRPPTQDELDRIVAPLLDALQMMHAENFLHRDIAPDNIIVRGDGSPVLLDFGAARRAVAEMSRTLTGVVKAGYSPHEQYSSDSRLQGPWSDVYALGATLYRAVAGQPPEEVALRVDQDHMRSAAQAATGTYRPGFLAAIDACLKVRYSERPQTIAQLRPILLAQSPPPKHQMEPPAKPSKGLTKALPTRRVSNARQPVAGRWLAIVAAVVALAGGAYGGLEYARWQPARKDSIVAEGNRPSAAEADSRARAATDANRRQAALDAERLRGEAEATRRQAEVDAQRRRDEEIARTAAQQEAARKADVAAAEKQKEDERVRVAAATLNADERAAFVKRVQTLLSQSRCYDGAVNGRSGETQEGLDRFVASADQKGKSKPARIELAKATAGDFEAWLRDASEIKEDLCTAKPKPPKQEAAKTPRQRDEENDPQSRRQAAAKPQGQPSAGGERPGRGGTCGSWMFHGTACTDSGGRRCTQTVGGRKCD